MLSPNSTKNRFGLRLWLCCCWSQFTFVSFFDADTRHVSLCRRNLFCQEQHSSSVESEANKEENIGSFWHGMMPKFKYVRVSWRSLITVKNVIFYSLRYEHATIPCIVRTLCGYFKLEKESWHVEFSLKYCNKYRLTSSSPITNGLVSHYTRQKQHAWAFASRGVHC